MAGGFREFANKKHIIILRGDKRLKFNWSEVLKGKNLTQNINLENGDRVMVQ
jgi:protein involved in polysaccharide export with SLBB domain